MLITTKRRYIKKHVIGGAGIFDTIVNFLKRSTAAKEIASRLSDAAQTKIGKKAIEAAKEVGLKAIDVGKDIVIAKVRALIAPKGQETVRQLTPVITQKSRDALASLIDANGSTTDINKLLAGSGVVSIQDLVKRLNTGSGLRLA